MRGCTHCGQENPAAARFCFACGQPLAEPARTSEERRVVSVVFVDLVGFTARSETLDPEDVRAFLNPYYERVRSELERFGGRVEKFIGDAVMGVFGAPVAYGDDHERAVRAALAVRDWAGEDGLEVRVAVNTGEAIVDLEARPDQGQAMIAGDVVNTAARLQTAAPVGSVLVGRETYASTRTSIEYQPGFEPIQAKGKSEPVQAWLALRASVAAGERALTRVPMVGRERELEVLKGIWERVVAERRPHLVTVFGPAGIGKSRLALELMEHVGSSRRLGYSAAARRRTARRARTARSRSTSSRWRRSTTATSCPRRARSSRRPCRSSSGRTRRGRPRGAPVPPARARRRGGGVRSRVPLLLRAAVRRVARRAGARRSSSSRTSTGRMRASSTSSRRSRRASATCPCSSSRSHARRCSPSGRAGRAGYRRTPPCPSIASPATRRSSSRSCSSPGASRRTRARRASPRRPRGTRSSSRSSPRRSPSARPPTRPSCRRACARSSPPASTRCRPRSEACSSTRRRWAACSGAERSPASRRARGSRRSSGSLEQRDLVRREAVSRIRGDEQYAFKHALIRDVAYQQLPRAARRERHLDDRPLPRGDDRRRRTVDSTRSRTTGARRETSRAPSSTSSPRATGRAAAGRRSTR